MRERARLAAMMASCLQIALAGILGAAVAAHAVILGGGTPEKDCWVVLDGLDDGGSRKVDCVDGDSSCDRDGEPDGVCSFDVRLCLNAEDVPHCRPRRIIEASIRGSGRGEIDVPLPLLPVRQAQCGEPGHVTVPVRLSGKRAKPGKYKLRMLARRKPRRRAVDKDSIRLTCLPATTPCSHASGCPKSLVLTVRTGSDLDLGSDGSVHDYALPAGWRLTFDLTGCGGTAYTHCRATAQTGRGSPNGETFGPPSPLVVTGMPVCLLHRFVAPAVGGSTDLETGRITANVDVLSEFYIGTEEHICPRCLGGTPAGAGTCDSGANAGGACVAQGTVATEETSYAVSSDCPPAPITLAGRAGVSLFLSTSSTQLQGPAPCAVPGIPAPPDDACSGTGCVESICECASTSAENGACVSARGGIRQTCCANDPTRSCFPTGAGSVGSLQRSGVGLPPQPALPDTTYPKIASDDRLVSTFCVQPTGGAAFDPTLAYRPGALVLPVSAVWLP